jgi:putative salt-induced outer membrane protein
MRILTKILCPAVATTILAIALSARAQAPAPAPAPVPAATNLTSASTNLAAAMATLAAASTNLANASTNPATASAQIAAALADLAAAQAKLSAASVNLAPPPPKLVASSAKLPPPHAKPVINPTNLWHMTVALGLTLARGNTDTTLFSLGAQAQKRWQGNDLNLRLDGLYGESKLAGETKSTETAESLHGAAQDNINFNDRLFGYGRVDGLHDGIADIDYRFTLAPGIGYYFIKNKISDLSLEAGPGYIFEKLDDQTQSFATLRLAQRFHYALSKRARLWETLELLPQVDNFDNYIANAELGIEASLNKSERLTLRTVIQDSYDSIPAPGHLKNDTKLIASVAYKF